LAFSHKDPADRFLAATSLVYDLCMVTVDEQILKCPKLKSLST